MTKTYLYRIATALPRQKAYNFFSAAIKAETMLFHVV